MGDLKRPMSGLEQGMTLVKRDINLSEETRHHSILQSM